MAKRLPWYKDLQILSYIGGGVVAIGAICTGIIVLSKYLTLPDRVEAGERHLTEHDKILDRLTVIQEQNEKLIQQQAPNIPTRSNQPIKDYDKKSQILWCCDEESSQACWDHHSWYECPSHYTVNELGRP